MINGQAVGLAGPVLLSTSKDTLHLIDLIYHQDGGARPEVIITDADSYSDIIFGLLPLLGFDYRPQLADLPDAKLWRIDLGRVHRHWPGILRVAASIHTGEVSAHDVIRMLNSTGTPPR